jgi:succinate-semialdehyde dehydrogenase/glutarate-semialdehyde dehydrogenase
MGKPIGEAEGEADKSALTAKYYAEHGPGVLADEHMDIDGSETWVAYE